MPSDSWRPYSAQKYAIGPSSSFAWRRWNQWSAPFDMYASNSARMSWYSAMNAGLASSCDQSTGPDRTGIGLR